MFGLDDKLIDAIGRVLKEFPSIEEAKIYGSRALGNFRPNSDVDIVLFGSLEDAVKIRVASAFDGLSTPYTFDVACYSQIQNIALKEHIDRVGKSFYKKK